MFEHEHGEVVGIGVGDVDVLSVHVDRRRETAGVDDAHESRRNRLRAESRGDGIQSEAGDGRLRHPWRGAGHMLRRHGLRLRGRYGNRTCEIVGRGENRQILLLEAQADARLVPELQSVRREVLSLGLRGVFRLA